MSHEEPRNVLSQGESEPFEYGGDDHEPSEAFKEIGKTARGIGVSTRHAYGIEDEAEETGVPQRQSGRPSSPIGTERSDDDAPTDVVNFEPREATPPTVVPD
jgi:hypothetical protein